jgi:hypothetical protein
MYSSKRKDGLTEAGMLYLLPSIANNRAHINPVSADGAWSRNRDPWSRESVNVRQRLVSMCSCVNNIISAEVELKELEEGCTGTGTGTVGLLVISRSGWSSRV